MAGAIIPIIAAAAPLLKPVIENLVLGVQRLFGHNNGTDTTKAASVIEAALVIADKLSTAGKIPGVVDATTIATMMETIISELKAKGLLPTDGVTIATLPSSQVPSVTGVLTSTAAPTSQWQWQTVRITGTMEVLK